MNSHNHSKIVAVVTPVYNRPGFTADEQVSLRHLTHFLGKYDRFLIAPKSLDIKYQDFKVVRFPDKCFGSLTAHNRLMLSRKFYRSFRDYEYILIYHLDALVFRDDLMRWCEKGLDYIGSPWLKCPDTPFVTTPRVGNGGLSLRKVASLLKVLESDKNEIDPHEYWRTTYAAAPTLVRYKNGPKKYLKCLRLFNGVAWEISQWHKRPGANEDHFWSDRATHYYPAFKIASINTALGFAFEAAPRKCFELNGGKIPFGCHAWCKYDRAFWEPLLLK
jgi:hypothetical protein